MRRVSAWVYTHAPTDTRWGKRGLSLLLSLALCLTLLPGAAFASGSDTSGHWAEKTITEWQQKGYISGYSDGSFRPDSSITRAEFVKIMNRVLGLTAEADISFSDVREGDWFYAEVAKAVAAGYATGSGSAFRPNAPITRAEAAAMIARAFKLTENEARAAQFTDADAIPAWARGSVGAVAEAGYMTGYPDGSFGASGNITRAEAVVTADRAERAAAEDTKKPVTPGTSSGGAVTPPAQKTSVTGVQPVADVMVDYGTSADDAIAQLPQKVTLTCADGTTVSASVASWTLDANSNYDAKPNTTKAYTATAEVTVPDGYANSGAKLTATAKLTVRGADKTVKSIAQRITDIEVATGTLENETAARAILPSGVTLLDTNGKKIPDVIAKISGWTLKDGTTFKGTLDAGETEYKNTFVGTVTIPAGYTYDGTLTAEAIIVVKQAGSSLNTKVIDNIICDIPDVDIEFTLNVPDIRVAIERTVKLPQTATLQCTDGSYVEVALSLPNDFTSSTAWSGSDVKSNNGDPIYPYFYKLSHTLSTSGANADITLPAGYVLYNSVSATLTARIKALDTASWDSFKEAYEAAKDLQEQIEKITAPAAATDAGKIYIVPTGTQPSAITKGVRFVMTSKAVTDAYNALNTELNRAKTPYNEGSGHRFNSQKQCTDMTAALNAAMKTVEETIQSNPQTGTNVNDAYVVGLVKIWLENHQTKAPWSEGAVLKPGDKYTLPKSNIFIEGEDFDASASRIVVSLEWTLPAELQEAADGHLEITQTLTEPKEVTLTATLKSYSINRGASITSDRTVGEYTALVGAPLAKDTTATIVDDIPELSSGAEPSNITVAVPLRGLQGTNQNIDKIQIPNLNDIPVVETTTEGNLLSGLELTYIEEHDSPSTAATYRVVKIGLKAGVDPNSRPEGSDYAIATIQITIPSQYITLNKEAIQAGWYLPKDGVVLTAEVRVRYSATTTTGEQP